MHDTYICHSFNHSCFTEECLWPHMHWNLYIYVYRNDSHLFWPFDKQQVTVNSSSNVLHAHTHTHTVFLALYTHTHEYAEQEKGQIGSDVQFFFLFRCIFQALFVTAFETPDVPIKTMISNFLHKKQQQWKDNFIQGCAYALHICLVGLHQVQYNTKWPEWCCIRPNVQWEEGRLTHVNSYWCIQT